MEYLNLLKLIPDAVSAVAVIIVVILFLRQQQLSQGHLNQIATDFQKSLNEQRDDFRQALTETSNMYLTQLAAMRGAHLHAVQEIAASLSMMEASSREMARSLQELHRLVAERVGLHYDSPIKDPVPDPTSPMARIATRLAAGDAKIDAQLADRASAQVVPPGGSPGPASP